MLLLQNPVRARIFADLRRLGLRLTSQLKAYSKLESELFIYSARDLDIIAGFLFGWSHKNV